MTAHIFLPWIASIFAVFQARVKPAGAKALCWLTYSACMFTFAYCSWKAGGR